MNKTVSAGLAGLAGLVFALGGCGEPSTIDSHVQAENAELKARNDDLNAKLMELSHGLSTKLPLKDCPFQSKMYFVKDYDSSKTYTGVFMELPKYYFDTFGARYARIRITFEGERDLTPMVIDLEHADKTQRFPPIITNLNHRAEKATIKLEGLTPLGETELVYEGPLNAQVIKDDSGITGFSY